MLDGSAIKHSMVGGLAALLRDGSLMAPTLLSWTRGPTCLVLASPVCGVTMQSSTSPFLSSLCQVQPLFLHIYNRAWRCCCHDLPTPGSGLQLRAPSLVVSPPLFPAIYVYQRVGMLAASLTYVHKLKTSQKHCGHVKSLSNSDPKVCIH